MKQFLLYLLYVGILFVIQIAVLLVLGLTNVSSNFTDGLLIFYFLPTGLILSILMQVFGLEPNWWLLFVIIPALVALAYALVIGAVLWLITFIIIRIRDNGLKT